MSSSAQDLSTQQHHASCFCGSVNVETTGQPLTVSICHCSRCRKLSGAPFVACLLFKPDQVKVTGGALSELATSPSVFRKRCESCGGPVLANMGKRVTVLPLALFDRTSKNEAGELLWTPQHHMYYDDRVMDVQDNLPKYQASTKGPLWEPGTPVSS